MVSLSFSHVISLSHPIHPQIPHWPGDPRTEQTTVAEWERDGYFLRRFAMGEHSGTHVNASRSFFPDGQAIADYSPEQWVLPGICIDVRDRCAMDRDTQVSVADLEQWETAHGRIPAGALAIAHTGWHQKWSDPVEFLGNGDDEHELHFPGFGETATAFLMNRRQVAGIGIDTHGVDPGTSETFEVNQQVLSANGIVAECLARLDQLPPTGFTVVIGVLPLTGGSGSPAQLLALLP